MTDEILNEEEGGGESNVTAGVEKTELPIDMKRKRKEEADDRVEEAFSSVELLAEAFKSKFKKPVPFTKDKSVFHEKAKEIASQLKKSHPHLDIVHEHDHKSNHVISGKTGEVFAHWSKDGGYDLSANASLKANLKESFDPALAEGLQRGESRGRLYKDAHGVTHDDEGHSDADDHYKKQYYNRGGQKKPTATKHYHQVPFAKKDEAKKEGMRFDGQTKKWYHTDAAKSKASAFKKH